MQRYTLFFTSLCSTSHIYIIWTSNSLIFRPKIFQKSLERKTWVKVYHDFVDLGLPCHSLWATENVSKNGSSLFAWGEVTPKQNFTWSNYKWMTYGQSTKEYIDKYTISDGNKNCSWYNDGTFVGDNIDELTVDDDAAYKIWGREWRMPSVGQFINLMNYCYWDYTFDYNGTGQWGFVIYRRILEDTSKKANESSCPDNYSPSTNVHIFLSDMDGYWTRMLDEDNSYNAVAVIDNVFECPSRYFGHFIRPVYASTTSPVMLADVNIDNVIDAADYAAIANFIMGKNRNMYSWYGADANSDGMVDVGDYMKVANEILSSTSNSVNKVAKSKNEVIYDATWDDCKTNESTGEICLNTIERSNIIAFQTDIALPHGYVLEKATAGNGSSVSFVRLSDNTWRLLAGSMANKTLNTPDNLLTLKVRGSAESEDGDIRVYNTLLVTVSEKKLYVQPTNIDINTVPTSLMNVKSDESDSSTSFDLNGRKWNHESKGIEIRAGKKILRK